VKITNGKRSRDTEIVLRFAVRCGFREARQKIFNLRGTPGQTVKELPACACSTKRTILLFAYLTLMDSSEERLDSSWQSSEVVVRCLAEVASLAPISAQPLD
jgi:hypothetical protein